MQQQMQGGNAARYGRRASRDVSDDAHPVANPGGFYQQPEQLTSGVGGTGRGTHTSVKMHAPPGGHSSVSFG